MTLLSKDHYELMDMFEREYEGFFRLDREPKDLWSKGHIYQNGQTNDLFNAYRRGFAYGRAAQ